MSLFRNAPVRRKLTLLAMICSVAALFVTSLSLGVYEWMYYRKSLYSHLSTLSAIAARNSAAALAFSNQDDAARGLATLQADPNILSAVLYDSRGRQFAEYRRSDWSEETPALAPLDGQTETATRLDIVVPVEEAKRFGSLLVRADISVIGDRLAVYAGVLVITTAISGLLALLLSGWLAKRIAAPVQALAGAAGKVQTTADYSIRVPKQEDDEFGSLTDAFNAMLARVQQNETDLYRNAERLRLALESAKIGTWDWDMVRDVVTWNERNYEIFGIDPGARITSNVFMSQIHPDDRARVKAAIEHAASNVSDFAVEFRLARPERPSHYAACRGRFLRSTAGDPLRAVGVTIDVTERRGAELRMIESELRFRAVAERAPAMIWSCDQTLHRDYFNKTWLNFTGRPLEQELGVGWQTGMLPADLFRWQEMVGAAAQQLDPYTIEYRLKRADGAMRWVIETGSPRIGTDGSFAGYLGSCIDITARKENEAELEEHVRRRTRELEVANQELESFSYSVSHDLRGPVRAIQGFAEIALEECQAGNPQAAVERLQRVIRAAERMNKLIDAFISMARISRAELTIDNVNLSKIAEDIIGFLRSAEPDREAETFVTPGLECRGDDRLLRIVLENLIGNAWKFTKRKEKARIEVGAQMQDGERVFFVRDNGAGFNRALAHKLFHAFERLHQASQFEGLGVGLSTVYRVIEKHNGRVWADAVEGEGATFFFTIPDVQAGDTGARQARVVSA
jgi:PAS domain S-box-containing protein